MIDFGIMDFSKINTSALRAMLQLSERKEALLAELNKLETEIASLLTGNSNIFFSASPETAKKTRKEKVIKPTSAASKEIARAARGTMKKQILEALAEAGPEGMKVSELSKKIGAKNANVHVWLSSAGKKLPEIERIAPGHFRIRTQS